MPSIRQPQGCVYSKAPGQHQQDLNGTRDNDLEATTHARDVSPCPILTSPRNILMFQVHSARKVEQAGLSKLFAELELQV